MAERKILTISIAAYNTENYIKECLESLIFDKLIDKIEILVINDGSTDKTASIVEEYMRLYPNSIYLINKKNGGWGSTVNKAIGLSNGKYFKLLDSDDLFFKRNLAGYISFLEENETDVVFTPFLEFESECKDNIKKYRISADVNLIKSQAVSEILSCFDYGMHMMTVRTDILKKNPIHLLENCFYTDIQFVLETNCYIKTCSFYNKIIYCYRVGRIGQSCSNQGYIKHYKEHIRVIKVCAERYRFFTGDKEVYDFAIRKLCSVAGKQYEIFGSFPGKSSVKKMEKWDQFLLTKYPKIYDNITVKRVLICRKIGFRFWRYVDASNNLLKRIKGNL